jgi:hypothetical protein
MIIYSREFVRVMLMCPPLVSKNETSVTFVSTKAPGSFSKKKGLAKYFMSFKITSWLSEARP